MHTAQNLDKSSNVITQYISNIYHFKKKLDKSVFVSRYKNLNQLKTFGDHIRKKRIDLNLQQRELAGTLKVNVGTIVNWENNRFEPAIEFIPRILDFLRYIPKELFKAKNTPKQIRVYRQVDGITQKELAKQLGIDPSTIMDWENGTNGLLSG